MEKLPTLTVQTDSLDYKKRSKVVISGTVTNQIGKTPVTLQIFTEGNLVDIAQIGVAKDGSYSHTVIAEGPLWKKVGTYTVRASQGESLIAETDFSYTTRTVLTHTI